MMISRIVGILLWEIWIRNRMKLIGIISFMLITWVAMVSYGPELKALGNQARFIYIPMYSTILGLLMVLIYAEIDPKSRYSGFPTHPMVLPVSTEMLVACPMICAVLVIPLAYASWVLFGFGPAGFDLPLGMPMLVLATGAVWFQAISWSLGRHPLLSGACLVLTVSVLFGLLMTFNSTLFPNPGPVLKAVVFSSFPALIFLAWRLAVFGVKRQRWNEELFSLPKLEFGPRENTRPFSSSMNAMFAFDWRHYGLFLPGILAMMCAILFVVPLARKVDERGFWLILGFSNLLIPMLGSLMGMELSKPYFGAKDTGPGAFRATLPLTDATIANARLKTAALSLAAALVVQWVFTFAWAAATGFSQTFFETISRLITDNGLPVFLAKVAVFYWILLVGAWGFMGNSIMLGWAVSTRLFAVLGASWLGLYVVGFMVSLWFSQNQETWLLVKDQLPYLGWVFCFVLLVVCFLLYRAAFKQGYLSLGLSSVFLGLALVAIVLAWFLLARLPFSPLQTRPLLLAFVDLTLLGLLPLAGGPLAMARKRHL